MMYRCFFFQAEDGIRDLVRSRGLGDVYKRQGGLEEVVAAAPVRVLIDHHQDPEKFSPVMFSDTSACSTCQMVYDIVNALGLSELITQDVATCLYTGLVTDTGSFRFRSTTAHTMKVGAALIEKGVDIEAVHSSISDDNTEDRLRLLGLTLSAVSSTHLTLPTSDLV